MGFQVCIPHRRPPRPNMSKRDQDIYKMLAKAGVPDLVKEDEDYDAEGDLYLLWITHRFPNLASNFEMIYVPQNKEETI